METFPRYESTGSFLRRVGLRFRVRIAIVGLLLAIVTLWNHKAEAAGPMVDLDKVYAVFVCGRNAPSPLEQGALHSVSPEVRVGVEGALKTAGFGYLFGRTPVLQSLQIAVTPRAVVARQNIVPTGGQANTCSYVGLAVLPIEAPPQEKGGI